jgi:NADH dehydrogenase
MSAFVLGATGFVGREVVRQLCVRGTKTTAHVRPDSKRLDEWRTKLGEQGAAVDTTPWQVVELAARFRELQPAQLYILIGTTRTRAKLEAVQGDIYESIDLGLTQLAVDAVTQARTATRLVYLSSVGADANARSAYLNARGKAEDLVKRSGLPWAIARPSIITGEREDTRFGESSAAFVGDGLLALASLIGGKQIRARYRSTTPDVLASALIRIGESPEHDRIYDGDDLR